MFSHAEEYFDACSEWAGYQGIRSKVRDGLTLDGILLVVQGEDDLRGLLEIINQGVGWEGLVPDKEQKFQEGLELDCHAVARALGVFTGTRHK